MPLDEQQRPTAASIAEQIASDRPRIVREAALRCEVALRGPQSYWPWRTGRSRQSLRVVEATAVNDDGLAYDVRSDVPYARWVNRAAKASPNSDLPNPNRWVVGATLRALWPNIIAQMGGKADPIAALGAGPRAAGAAAGAAGIGGRTWQREVHKFLNAEQRRQRKNRRARQRYHRRAREYDLLQTAGELSFGLLSPRGHSERGRHGGRDLIDKALVKRRIDRKLHRPLRPARRYLRRHPTQGKIVRTIANLPDTLVDRPYAASFGRIDGSVDAREPKLSSKTVIRTNPRAQRQIRDAVRTARRHIDRA